MKLVILILCSILTTTQSTYAKGWEVGLGVLSVFSGTIQISSSNSMTELALVTELKKQLPYKLKIFKKGVNVWLGGELHVGDVEYSTGTVVREGKHIKFGASCDLRINWNKNYFSDFGLSLAPYIKSSVFSKISSNFDGELFSSTSQTDLVGWGWSFPFSLGRWFKLKALGLKLNFATKAEVGLHGEIYNSRSDTTVQIGQESQDVTVTNTTMSGSFAANYLTGAFSINFTF